jgi:hypothetical protein
LEVEPEPKVVVAEQRAGVNTVRTLLLSLPLALAL